MVKLFLPLYFVCLVVVVTVAVVAREMFEQQILRLMWWLSLGLPLCNELDLMFLENDMWPAYDHSSTTVDYNYYNNSQKSMQSTRVLQLQSSVCGGVIVGGVIVGG